MSFAALARKRAPGRYGYLALPGTTGCYASAPDSVALSVTGDIDLRCKVALADWTPTASQGLVSKYGPSTISYRFMVLTGGTLYFSLSQNGSAKTDVGSSVVTGIADGATSWARVTWQASDGRVQFFTSSNGTDWTQLGTNRTISYSSIYDSTNLLRVGELGDGTALSTGNFYRAQVYNGIAGTLVFDADFTDTGRTFIEPASGATVTVNGAAAIASVHP